jgi:hypothetical protein
VVSESVTLLEMSLASSARPVDEGVMKFKAFDWLEVMPCEEGCEIFDFMVNS